MAVKVWHSYQTDRVCKSALESVILQKLPKVGNVARSETKGVQFGKFGVRWDPGQAGFQSGESFAQHSHPRPLPGVSRVPLRLSRFPLVRFGKSVLLLDPLLNTFVFQLLLRVPAGIIAGDFPRGGLQGSGSPFVACLVVLGITCSRASGHGCSTCAWGNRPEWHCGRQTTVK